MLWGVFMWHGLLKHVIDCTASWPFAPIDGIYVHQNVFYHYNELCHWAKFAQNWFEKNSAEFQWIVFTRDKLCIYVTLWRDWYTKKILHLQTQAAVNSYLNSMTEQGICSISFGILVELFSGFLFSWSLWSSKKFKCNVNHLSPWILFLYCLPQFLPLSVTPCILETLFPCL